jgi:hypothetical protein
VKGLLIGFILLAVGGVGLWGFSRQWGEPMALIYAMPLFLLAAWFIADSVNSLTKEPVSPRNEHVMRPTYLANETRTSSGLRVWFRISLSVAVVSALLAVALVASALHWDWVAGRVGGVLAPAGAVVVAAIASAGAARTLMAQSDIAERNRLEDAEGLLWTRFDKAAEELADENHFATRAAGVYSLVSLADDWIRYHQRLKAIGVESGDATTECQTIIDILCAQLRRNTHLNERLDTVEVLEETLVNEAIIGQFAAHFWLPRAEDTDPTGMWAGRELLVDIRGTDLCDSLWSQVDLKGAVLKRADLYNSDLTGADLSDADLSWADVRKAYLTGEKLTSKTKFDNVLFDGETLWPDGIEIKRAPPGEPFLLRRDGVDIKAWVVLRRAGLDDSPAWEIPTRTRHRQPRPTKDPDS